jgi:16S rRNA (cytosine1402-N4)-methyltransferase
MGGEQVLADLGVSSMQLDDPMRGMTFKSNGPLDMRLDQTRGKPASERLAELDEKALAELLVANSDEERAGDIAAAVWAAMPVETTAQLAEAVRAGLPATEPDEEVKATTRRVFQALRIAVNDEFGKLDALLRALPWVLKPGGRVAVLTFHSGEDRRVKQAFKKGLRDGSYSAISTDIIRPSWEEQKSNPRAKSAKLRWARR